MTSALLVLQSYDRDKQQRVRAALACVTVSPGTVKGMAGMNPLVSSSLV